MGMSGGGSGGTMADINVTPLVDVMLVLLIIFMITAPMMNNAGVEIDLPKADAPPLTMDDEDADRPVDAGGRPRPDERPRHAVHARGAPGPPAGDRRGEPGSSGVPPRRRRSSVPHGREAPGGREEGGNAAGRPRVRPRSGTRTKRRRRSEPDSAASNPGARDAAGADAAAAPVAARVPRVFGPDARERGALSAVAMTGVYAMMADVRAVLPRGSADGGHRGLDGGPPEVEAERPGPRSAGQGGVRPGGADPGAAAGQGVGPRRSTRTSPRRIRETRRRSAASRSSKTRGSGCSRTSRTLPKVRRIATRPTRTARKTLEMAMHRGRRPGRPGDGRLAGQGLQPDQAELPSAVHARRHPAVSWTSRWTARPARSCRPTVTEPSGLLQFDSAAERAVDDVPSLPLPPEKYRKWIAKEGVGIRFTPP